MHASPALNPGLPEAENDRQGIQGLKGARVRSEAVTPIPVNRLFAVWTRDSDGDCLDAAAPHAGLAAVPDKAIDLDSTAGARFVWPLAPVALTP